MAEIRYNCRKFGQILTKKSLHSPSNAMLIVEPIVNLEATIPHTGDTESLDRCG